MSIVHATRPKYRKVSKRSPATLADCPTIVMAQPPGKVEGRRVEDGGSGTPTEIKAFFARMIRPPGE